MNLMNSMKTFGWVNKHINYFITLRMFELFEFILHLDFDALFCCWLFHVREQFVLTLKLSKKEMKCLIWQFWIKTSTFLYLKIETWKNSLNHWHKLVYIVTLIQVNFLTKFFYRSQLSSWITIFKNMIYNSFYISSSYHGMKFQNVSYKSYDKMRKNRQSQSLLRRPCCSYNKMFSEHEHNTDIQFLSTTKWNSKSLEFLYHRCPTP